jgi:hypothetical protein
VGSAAEVLDALDELVDLDPGHIVGLAAVVMLRGVSGLWAEGRMDEAEVVLDAVHRLPGGAWTDQAAPLDHGSDA